MDESSTTALLNGAIAGGIGLVVGLEREHEQAPVHDPILGVRTFTLLALLGWACALSPAPWLVPAALLAVAAFLIATYLRGPSDDLGLTTEVSAMVTFVSGTIVALDRMVAMALGLATALLLLSKPWVRAMVPRLKRIELSATLQLLIVLAIVLPLLPDRPVDPWGVVSPRKVGIFVTLIAGISYVGYVAARLLGRSRGAGLSGIVGGLASSTAVTVAMANAAKRDEVMRAPGQLATFLANTVMCVRVAIITAVASTEVARRLALPLGALAVVLLAGAAWKFPSARRSEAGAIEGPELKNPFAILPALKWGVFLVAVQLLATFAKWWLGDKGVLLAAAASGIADVDPITLSVSRQAGGGQLDVGVAVLAIIIAVMTNMIMKGAVAVVTGGRGYGRDIALVFAAGVALSVTVAALV